MALLQKIFQGDRRRRQWCSKGTRKEPNFLSPEKLTSHKWWQPPEFDPSQIRLIVFTDSDSVKKLRFDSKTVKKVDQTGLGMVGNLTAAMLLLFMPVTSDRRKVYL